MAPTSAERTRDQCHLVAMPYPGRGHINPMMNLCRSIASRIDRRRLLITFVVTEEWFGFIRSNDLPANVRLAAIPDVLPSERVRASDMPGFLEAVQTELQEPFERLLDRLEPWPLKLIVFDTILSWMTDLGNRRNVPVASLWTMPASVFALFFHSELLVRNHHFPCGATAEKGKELVDYIPGVSSLRVADLPTPFTKHPGLLPSSLRAFSTVPNSQYILFSSFQDLETQVLTALKPNFSAPLYCIGPLIPHMKLSSGSNHCRSDTSTEDGNYMEWLDSQPRSSVLYISLGSFLSIPKPQMDEIAAGLRDSGVKYLWMARGEASRLEGGCGSAGMVVPWCDQLKVLCHVSVGGFWTHCGWNSTMEGIFAGVPMLALPILMDQFTNSKLVREDWKVGWDVRKEIGGESLRRDGVAGLVRRFMDLENPERKEMSRNARELRDTCRRAIAKGGSSDINLDSFLEDIAIL